MGSSVSVVESPCAANRPVVLDDSTAVIGCIGPAAFSVSLALSRLSRSYTPPEQRSSLSSFTPLALFYVSPTTLDGFYDDEQSILVFDFVKKSIQDQCPKGVLCGVHYRCSPVSKNSIDSGINKIFNHVGDMLGVFVVSSHPADRIEDLRKGVGLVQKTYPTTNVWVNITPDVIARHPDGKDLASWINQNWCLNLGVSGFIFDLHANHKVIADTIDAMNSSVSGSLFRFFLANSFTRDWNLYPVVAELMSRWQNINFLQQNHLTVSMPSPVVDPLVVAQFFSRASCVIKRDSSAFSAPLVSL
ncbi:MAG: hypothetical protein RIQ54_41 [Candidatus Parcubacteria bacterium]|jgi:hypothetical protein